MIGLEFATHEIGYAFARGAFARHVSNVIATKV